MAPPRVVPLVVGFFVFSLRLRALKGIQVVLWRWLGDKTFHGYIDQKGEVVVQACPAQQIQILSALQDVPGVMPLLDVASVHSSDGLLDILDQDEFFDGQVIIMPKLVSIQELQLDSFFEVFKQVSRTLAIFKDRGYVHRNIRSSHLFVNGRVVLGNFFRARAWDVDGWNRDFEDLCNICQR